MRYYIITGTSRGLGLALAEALTVPGNHLICLTRTENPELTTLAMENGAMLTNIKVEMSDVLSIENAANQAMAIVQKPCEGVYLVNNAATIQPMALIEDCGAQAIADAYLINVVAPSVLVGSLIKHTQTWEVPKRILNISSGAGKRPFEGWSIYCGTKAAIDLFSQTVAKEQGLRQFPIEVASFAPGVIDTDLQAEIRRTGPEAFPNVAQFHALKEDGNLRAAKDVAAVIVDVIHGEKFEQGGILDIRNLA